MQEGMGEIDQARSACLAVTPQVVAQRRADIIETIYRAADELMHQMPNLEADLLKFVRVKDHSEQ